MPRNQPRSSRGRSAIARRAINTNSTNGMMYQGTCIAQDGTIVYPCREFGGMKKGGAYPSATGFMRSRPWQTSVNAKHTNYIFRINKLMDKSATTPPTVNKCKVNSDCSSGYHCHPGGKTSDKLTGCMLDSDMVAEEQSIYHSINLGNMPIYNIMPTKNDCLLSTHAPGTRVSLDNDTFCCSTLIDGSCADSTGFCHIDSSTNLCGRLISMCPSGEQLPGCLESMIDTSHAQPDWSQRSDMSQCLGHGPSSNRPITSQDMTGGWQWLKHLPCKKCVATPQAEAKGGTDCGEYTDANTGEPTDECSQNSECVVAPNEPICLSSDECNTSGLNSSSLPHKCVWWGRGVIQTTGRCNYGKLNKALQNVTDDEHKPLLSKSLCEDPYQICASGGAGPLPWHAGFFFWINGVQGFGTTTSTYKKDWPKPPVSNPQTGFIDLFSDISNITTISGVIKELLNNTNGPVGRLIDSLSGIVNRGCPANKCPGSGEVDGLVNRRDYFKGVLTIFKDVGMNDNSYIDTIKAKSSELNIYINNVTPPAKSKYTADGCISGLIFADAIGYNGMKFYAGDSTKSNNMVGIVNFCAFLAQCRQETLQYGACDENNWSMDATWLNGLPGRSGPQIVLDGHTALGWTDPSYVYSPQPYTVTAACGQLGQIYNDYDCSDACPGFSGEIHPGTTKASWKGAPDSIGSKCKTDAIQAAGCNFPPQKYWKKLIPNCFGVEASNCTLEGLITCGKDMEPPPPPPDKFWCDNSNNSEWVDMITESSGCLITYNNGTSWTDASYVHTEVACKNLYKPPGQLTHWCIKNNNIYISQ